VTSARNVLVVSGDRLFGEAVTAALRAAGWAASFAADGLTAVGAIARAVPHAVLVLGDDVPRLGAVPLAQQVRRRWPAVTVVAVGTPPVAEAVVLPPACATADVLEALAAAPPAGTVAETPARAELPVLATLTRRQRVVLRLLVEGRDMRSIGQELGLSENTVRTHMQNLYARLGCHSRLELVRFATEHGLLGGPTESSSG
jgi:DNA-binding CsgD family transcriptional regulator